MSSSGWQAPDFGIPNSLRLLEFLDPRALSSSKKDIPLPTISLLLECDHWGTAVIGSQ